MSGQENSAPRDRLEAFLQYRCLRAILEPSRQRTCYETFLEIAGTMSAMSLFAPAIQNGVCHGIAHCFVAHGPLKLVNPVVVLLLKFSFHRIRNF